MCSLLETRCVRRLDHRPHRDELEPFRFCAALPIPGSLLGTDGERRVIDQGEPEVSTRRTSMVIAAVVLGGIASFSLYRHLDGIERQVYADARPVEVVVVDVAIAEGTSGDQALTGAVSTRPMPAEFRPATAVASPEAIRGKVAALDLPVGTIVVENMFVDAEQARDTNAELIPEGMVAVSISVDQVRGVSGLVRPGDKVNMIVEDPTSPGTKQVLFQNVDVLFVGQAKTRRWRRRRRRPPTRRRGGCSRSPSRPWRHPRSPWSATPASTWRWCRATTFPSRFLPSTVTTS
jgi:pilus assembly protein CpaB